MNNLIRIEMKYLIYIMAIFFSCSLFGQEEKTLSLEDALSTSLKNNYGIVMQESNVIIAEKQNNWGNTGALPNISFVGAGNENFSFSDDDSQTSSLNGSVELNWTIFRGFSAKISKEKLDKLENLSEDGLNIIVENTIVGVITAYNQALLNIENSKITESVMNLSKDRFEKEKQKKDMGSSGTYNLLQAQNAYLEDKSNYLSASANYKMTIRSLNFLMAVDIDESYVLTDTLHYELKDFDLQDLSTRMLANNNTLKSQYLNLEMARLDVKQAKSSYYPTLALSANGGYSNMNNNYDVNDLMDSDRSAFNTGAGLSVSYTIYNGGVRKQGLEVAKMRNEIKMVETTEMEQEMKMSLAQELDLYDLRKELLMLSKENLAAAELNLQLSKEKYESGSINSFNYRDVQQLYSYLAMKYQSAVYNVIESNNSLLRLTGGIIDRYTLETESEE